MPRLHEGSSRERETARFAASDALSSAVDADHTDKVHVLECLNSSRDSVQGVRSFGFGGVGAGVLREAVSEPCLLSGFDESSFL